MIALTVEECAAITKCPDHEGDHFGCHWLFVVCVLRERGEGLATRCGVAFRHVPLTVEKMHDIATGWNEEPQR